jgi:hypothetical protein
MRAKYFFTVVTLWTALAPGGTLAQGQTIKPSRNLIIGLVSGEEVEKLMPPNGFIAVFPRAGIKTIEGKAIADK